MELNSTGPDPLPVREKWSPDDKIIRLLLVLSCRAPRRYLAGIIDLNPFKTFINAYYPHEIPGQARDDCYQPLSKHSIH